MSNEAKITDPLNMDSILLKASQEILSKHYGFCFSVDNDETVNEKTFYTPHDSSEFAEFVNFDLLGEEGENLKSTNHLINCKKYENITKDGVT
ncbi:Hypothetical protein CINCED_3A006207 [Cinara cedri]|uniref:Uncharacterized protein n=1 Tax=Cinara cedri TaxID=506608 RepID=A0A5E4MPH1_9HEMI|nr:Hypothetical protein CINCED_3A006207 [Cinara cedri]